MREQLLVETGTSTHCGRGGEIAYPLSKKSISRNRYSDAPEAQQYTMSTRKVLDLGPLASRVLMTWTMVEGGRKMQ